MFKLKPTLTYIANLDRQMHTQINSENNDVLKFKSTLPLDESDGSCHHAFDPIYPPPTNIIIFLQKCLLVTCEALLGWDVKGTMAHY